MEAGAREYFDKSVEELTLAECATLASISKNPTGYNPSTNPENLIARRNHVLWEMLDQGYITQEEYDSATQETVTLAESKSKTENVAVESNYSYFTEAALEELTQDIKEAYGFESDAEAQNYIFTAGLRVYTTVDPGRSGCGGKPDANEPDENGNVLFPALWHEEEVESDIPVGSEYSLDSNGMPMNPTDETTGTIFQLDDTPIYNDDGTFKTGTYETTDENGTLPANT